MTILLLTHVTGCFWYFVSKFTEDGEENWIITFGRENQKSNLNLYILSFYWAVSTICTVGLGDIVPTTTPEKLFNLFWIMIGVAFYSYVVGILSTILNNQNKKKSSISQRFEYISEL